MKKYSEMTDLEINKAVAAQFCPKAVFERDGKLVYPVANPYPQFSGVDFNDVEYDPCNDPGDAWPIIAAEAISLIFDGDGYDTTESNWVRAVTPCGCECYENQDHPLRAAMIVFLMMKESDDGRMDNKAG